MEDKHVHDMFHEYNIYYTTFDDNVVRYRAEVPKWKAEAAESGLDNYARKAYLTQKLCEESPVHLFRNTPLFFEASTGKSRTSWGGWDIGLDDEKWKQPYWDELCPDREQGFLHNWNNPVGMDHHCPDYDNVLQKGINGILAEAKAHFAAETDPRKKRFYAAVISDNESLLLLTRKFAAEGERLAALAQTDEERAHYAEIAETAKRIPAEPPRTFREALNMVMMYRELVCGLDGLGISTFGQLDRMLYPYYRDDLAAGRITREAACRLLGDLLQYTDARFRCRSVHFFETSTTIQLGGCDRDGNVNYNEVTEMVLEAAVTVHNLNTKLNCRISRRHPKAFLEQIAKVQLAKLPCVMVHNDDVLIPARVKHGQDVRDARLYVSGGCHEVVLQGTEVCTRADTWINVPRIFMKTLQTHLDCTDYDVFYRAFIDDVKAYHEHIAETKNRYEALWCEKFPLPLYSSSFAIAMEKGKDITEGGAKYNSTALSMVGAATAADSLFAVKKLVFDEHKLTLSELSDILDKNFEGQEPLRQYIIHRLPKYGTGDDTLNEFSAKLLRDLSGVSGQTNARGGKYYPAFYPHDIYVHLGQRTGATPDGRLAGTPISRGASPSEFIACAPVDVLHSAKRIDFTDFTDSFITEITLPELPNDEKGIRILVTVLEGFLDAEGSSMQFNLLSREDLADARLHPDQHPNLYVRVCGYSARYTSLSPELQDEILNRAIR